MNRILISLAVTFLTTLSASSQSYRSTVNEGNDLYHQGQYDAAKKKYQSAATVAPERIESHFNSGNAEYRNDDFKAAIESYKKAGERARSPEEGSQIWYNAGNSFLNAAEKGAQVPMADAQGNDVNAMRKEGYKNAIEAYKQALKLNPKDEDARYNLTYAMRKLQELNNQQNNQNQNKDQQKQDQKQDKDKDDQNKEKDKEQEQNKQDKKDEQQKQDQQKQNEQQEQQKQRKPEQQKQMSKQQAEQILKALERDEKELQKKLREKRAVRVNVDKDW